MKKIKFIFCFLIMVGISCTNCACAPGLVSGLAQDIGINLIKEGLRAAGRDKPIFGGEKGQNNTLETGRLIEEHIIGTNVVNLHEATYQGSPGYYFVAYCDSQLKGDVFYSQSDENDMKEYALFTKMSLLQKKLFLCESFQKFANVDLGSVYPQVGATYEQAIAAIGKPDDRIPLYYEEGIAVSEMLIYYESPKKFLAVGIARGKVVKTQEFALSEGQGLKDALASAGITPAIAPEPTPAPSVRIPLGSIPTTGFISR